MFEFRIIVQNVSKNTLLFVYVHMYIYVYVCIYNCIQ